MKVSTIMKLFSLNMRVNMCTVEKVEVNLAASMKKGHVRKP